MCGKDKFFIFRQFLNLKHTRMKRILFGWFLVGLSICLFACEQGQRTDGTDEGNPYAFVGKLHNEGLNYVFNYLQTIKITRAGEWIDHSELCEIAVLKFAQEKNLNYQPVFATRSVASWESGEELGLSERATAYYEELMQAIHAENQQESVLKGKIKTLEKEIMDDSALDESGRAALLCGTATALESLNYWNENAQTWSAETTMATRSSVKITVSGSVVDEMGCPFAGVTVLQKGTTNGVSTDVDGNFRLMVPGNAILVFSFVGCQTQEVPVKGRTGFSIVMTSSEEPGFWDSGWGKTLKVVGCDVVGAIFGYCKGSWGGAVANGVEASSCAAIGVF